MPTLRKVLSRRAYAALATLTLTLAVGANLVVFSVVKAIWLRPDPVSHADRLVMVLGDDSNSGPSDSFFFAELGLESQLRSSGLFAGVAGQVATTGYESSFTPHVVLADVGHEVETTGVTFQYFSVLGVTIRGRDFTRDDDRYGAEAVGIISDRLWRNVFGARANVIGALMPANPMPLRVVGVAPAGFEGARLGEHTDLWIPANQVPRVAPVGESRIRENEVSLLALARLREGLSVSQADRLLTEHVAAAALKSPARLRVVSLRQIFGAPDSRTIIIREETVLRVVTASAALVLLAGCVTLIALVLVHYERRRHELSVRLALGATRARLAKQLAAELGWLTVPGVVGASLFASWSLRALPSLNLPGGVDLSRLNLAVDWQVVLAAVTFNLLVLLAAAALPIARFTRPDLARNLVTTTATASASSHRVRGVLLGLHVMSTMVLLVAAGLFVRTVVYGFTQGPGFDVNRTLFVDLQVDPMFVRWDEDLDASARQRLADEHRMVEKLRTLPGLDVVSIGAAPIGPSPARMMLNPWTATIGTETHELRFVSAPVGEQFLEALNVPVLQGRMLTADDQGARPTPVVVTASLARQLFPGGSPIGRDFDLAGKRVIMGVIPDVAFGSFALPHSEALLRVVTLDGNAKSHELSLTIRSERPEAVVGDVRRVIASVFPDAPRVELATGREVVARDLGRERLGAWFFSGFGVVALALGVGGVFGLVAYLAESRRRELGVRVALGATPRDLLRQVIGIGLRPVLFGAAVGLGSAALLARFVSSLLVGVGQFDLLTYLSAGFAMIGCAGVAGLVGAWRVRRLSPLDALRSD